MNQPNPRAVLGGNEAPDYAKIEVERLGDEYSELFKTVDELVEKAEAFTGEIETPEEKEIVVDLIKRSRDAKTRIEAIHDSEKQPHFRRGQGVDQIFFGAWDRLLRRDKKNRPGSADILNEKLTRYDARVLAEEQERRRLKALEDRKAADQIAAEAENVERDRIAAEAAAARARKPENVAERTAEATQAAGRGVGLRGDAAVAETRAHESRIATLAKPADIMRTRTGAGTLSTMGTEKFAEITNRNELDLEKLRPFIPLDSLEQALRAYAGSVGYSDDASVQIKGAVFGKRARSQVR